MTAHTRQFGRIPSPPNKRDDALVLRKVKSTRVSRYWSMGKLKVLDQLATPHCVGYAAANALYATPIRRFADPDGIYAACKLIDGIPEEDGTYIWAVAKVLKAAGAIEAYRLATNVDAIITNILEVGPMIVGTDWYEDMDEGGTMRATGDIYGGHAYLLRGVNRKRGLIRVRNSWGPEWSDNGEADLPIEELKTLLENEGEFLLAKEAEPERKWLKS